MGALDRRNLVGNSPAISPIKKQNQPTPLEDTTEGCAARLAPTAGEARGARAAPQQRALTVTPESGGEQGANRSLFFLGLACFLGPLKPPKLRQQHGPKQRHVSQLTSHLLNATERTQVAGGGGLLQKLQREGKASRQTQVETGRGSFRT